ncbi:thiamine pyrophosphokinase [Xylogone sp. PMI_703]|nr:thiamine pyrophosphokinase [Xylogone sp. PMI_703]
MGTTAWQPFDVLNASQDGGKIHKDFVLVVLHQPMELSSKIYAEIWRNSILHIGADGGANRVHDLNVHHKAEKQSKDFLNLDLVIGDLDSLRPESKAYWQELGTTFIKDPDQESTDFTKAVNYAQSLDYKRYSELVSAHAPQDQRRAVLDESIYGTKAKNFLCIGGLGGRIDQGFSTMHHLYMFQKDPEYRTGRMFLLSSEGITFVLKSGKHEIRVWGKNEICGLGKHIGIIPLREPSVITTKGLKWDVTDWPTAFGDRVSTSNHVDAEYVTIETTKDVLFTIDLNTKVVP